MDSIESQVSSSTAAELTGAELIVGLSSSLRGGTVLDLRNGSIPADLIRDALLGKRPGGRDEPVIELTDIDPRGLLITNAVIQGHLDLDSTGSRRRP